VGIAVPRQASQVKYTISKIIENLTVHAKGISKALKTKGSCNADVTEFGISAAFYYQLGRGSFITALSSRGFASRDVYAMFFVCHNMSFFCYFLILLSFKSEGGRSKASTSVTALP